MSGGNHACHCSVLFEAEGGAGSACADGGWRRRRKSGSERETEREKERERDVLNDLPHHGPRGDGKRGRRGRERITQAPSHKEYGKSRWGGCLDFVQDSSVLVDGGCENQRDDGHELDEDIQGWS